MSERTDRHGAEGFGHDMALFAESDAMDIASGSAGSTADGPGPDDIGWWEQKAAKLNSAIDIWWNRNRDLSTLRPFLEDVCRGEDLACILLYDTIWIFLPDCNKALMLVDGEQARRGHRDAGEFGFLVFMRSDSDMFFEPEELDAAFYVHLPFRYLLGT